VEGGKRKEPEAEAQISRKKQPRLGFGSAQIFKVQNLRRGS
jgi:hypothetical protein